VGSYAIIGAVLSAKQGNYVLVQAPANASALSITPAALTVRAADASKTYGQSASLIGFGSSGLRNGETIGGVTLSSRGAPVAANVGAYPITPSAATGGSFNPVNYAITYVPGTLTVNPSPLLDATMTYVLGQGNGSLSAPADEEPLRKLKAGAKGFALRILNGGISLPRGLSPAPAAPSAP